MMLRIIPITNDGLDKLNGYVLSATNPSLKDRIRLWKTKQITKLIYKGVSEPKMLREEWDDKLNILSIIVEDNYVQYGRDLLENCKINFLKLVKANDDDFRLDVIE